MSQGCPLVIVLNWNGGQELLECLQSLKEAREQNVVHPFDVLLVDNGSSEGAFVQACNQFPEVHVLTLPRNLYWAGGNNVAIAWALERGYPWLVFCNSDIIVDVRWSQALAHFDHCKAIAAVGFQVLGEHSRVPFADFEVVRSQFQISQLAFEDDLYISGCFLAVRSCCFSRLGFFDEIYQMYSEEDDFLVRVRLAGWRTIRCNAPIWHASELASRRVPLFTSYLAIRNTLRLRLKFGPRRWRSGIGFALRVLAGMLNPMRPVNLVDSYQRRLKPSANLFVNLPILVAACVWNLLHLGQTLSLARRDRRAALQARC